MTHPTDDESAAVKFYTENPSAALVDFDKRRSGRALLAEQARTQTHKAEDAPSDAELLDWLEAQDLNDIAVIRQTNNVVGINVGHGPAYGKTLRAAIRAAIAQERKA